MPVRATPARDSAQRSRVCSEMASLTLRRYQPALGETRGQDFVNGAHEAGIERAKLRVERRGLVKAHGIHALLQVINVHTKERDAPLPVVQAGRSRDHLEDATLEGPANRP